MNWTGDIHARTGNADPRSEKHLEAYCQGVNRALSRKNSLGIQAVRIQPDPWLAEDSILISRMIGYLTLAQSQGEMERFLIEMVQAGMDEDPPA